MTGNELIKQLSDESGLSEREVVFRILTNWNLLSNVERIVYNRTTGQYHFTSEYKQLQLGIPEPN